jgi:hypothetical protein
VVKIKHTCSRERDSRITRKEDSLIPLYKDLDALTRNLKGKKMYNIKVERRRHACNMEILDMWRNYTIIRETI